MTTDNGQIATQFLKTSPNFSGTLQYEPEQQSANTKARLVIENTMKGVAIQQKIPLDKLVTDTLKKFPDSLRAFIIAHGEIPVQGDPVKLALQAVLLRAQDVAQGANAIDTTDDIALMNIEQAEQGAQSDNTPDNETVLPIDIQAAMKIAMDYLSDCHVQAGGDGSMSSALKDWQTYAVNTGNATGIAIKSNNADGDSAIDYGLDLGGDYIPSSASLPGLASIPQSGGTSINPQTGLPNIVAGSVPNSNTSGMVNSASNSSGIFGAITSVLDGISSVAGSVTNAANAVNNTNSAIRGTVNNYGSSILQNYLRQNKTQVILIILAVAALLFVVIYAAKKSK